MKEKKTRNDLIRTLYKPGLGGTIGRAQHPPISRQRVFQIVSEKQIPHKSLTNILNSAIIKLLRRTLWKKSV